MHGIPSERAVRMPLAIFSAWALPTAPASTVRSWANRYTGRPSTRAKPHTTPSVGCRRSAMPKSVHWVSASMNSSVKLPGSTSRSIRSRAVSLPSPCCLSMARSSPARTRASSSVSLVSGVGASGVDFSGVVVSSAIQGSSCGGHSSLRPSTIAPLARRYAQDARGKGFALRLPLGDGKEISYALPLAPTGAFSPRIEVIPKPANANRLNQPVRPERSAASAERSRRAPSSLPLMPVFPTRQPVKSSPVLSHQRFLLLPAPALDLQFGCQRFRPTRERAGVYEREGVCGTRCSR